MIKRLLAKIGISGVSFIIAIFLITGITIVFGDWQEPPSLPPGSPIGAPLVTQSQYQEKFAAPGLGVPQAFSGSIGANDFWVHSVGKWMSELGGGTACDWSAEHWRCECATEQSGLQGRVIIGLRCVNGVIDDFKIVEIGVGNSIPNCTGNIPVTCGIFNRNNFVNAPNSLNGTYNDPLGPPPPYIILYWNDASANEDGFRIEGYNSAGDWGQITTVPMNTSWWTGSPAFSSAFRIRAFLDNNIVSNPSNVITLP